MPFLGRAIEARWFSWPNIAFLAPIPLVTAFVAWQLYRALQESRHVRPFFLAIALFLLGYLGLGDQPLPLCRAAEPDDLAGGQHGAFAAFALVGFAIVLPITLAYNAYAYWVFRGKVAEDIQASSYH